MNQYLSSASLKAMARGQLLGNYGTATGAYLLQFLCTVPFSLFLPRLIGTQTPGRFILSLVLSLLINIFSGFFISGEAYLYLKLACNQPVLISDVFYGFRNELSKVFTVSAILSVVYCVCTLPASIAGFFLNAANLNAAVFLIYSVLFVLGIGASIVISLLFSQVYYLMLDFPDASIAELFQRSQKIMKGSLGRLFYIQISFIPLTLLGIMSCGVGLLWLQPYIMSTKANFYLDIMKKRQKQ